VKALRVLALVIAAVVFSGTVALPAHAEPQLRPGGRDVLILMDTSGSMRNKDAQGRVKMQAAKSAILTQIQELPADARLGLMTYPAQGLPAVNGCQAAETRSEVSGHSLETIGSTLGILPEPDGETPTGEALVQAATYLEANALAGVTIVLISDGESNCGRDSCEAAKEVKAKGTDVVINTVGFDIASGGKSELQCIATAGGGTFADASDADQLSKVLREQFGNGLTLEVQGPGAPVPLTEGAFQVSVKVTAANGQDPRDITLSVRDTDATSNLFARRPFVRVGNLPAGQSRTVVWSVSPPSNPKLDKTVLEITAGSVGSAPVSRTLEVTYSHGAASGSTARGALKEFRNVLVLGDSYSSGEGAGDQDRPYFTNQGQAAGCHRTKNQYAGWLFSAEQVTVLACSGAKSRNLYDAGQNGEESQLQQLRRLLEGGYRPDAVFLSIGGNDVGFEAIVRSCATAPLTVCTARLGPSAVQQETAGLIKAVPEILRRSLSEVKRTFEEAPVATMPPVLVLPYPKLFAKDYTTAELKCVGEPRFQAFLLSGDYEAFDDLQLSLNSEVAKGVELARKEEGVPAYFVSEVMNAVPSQHTICSPAPWFVTLTFGGAVEGSPEMFHPNVQGHQAMAAKINSWAAAPGTQLRAADVPATRADWRDYAASAWITASEVGVDIARTERPEFPVFVKYGDFTVNLRGGLPQTDATVYLKSTPLPLGTISLDAAGAGTIKVNLQAKDLPPGEHTLNVITTTAAGAVVVRSVPVSFEQPFPAVFWILWAVAALIVAACIVPASRVWRNRKAFQ
jgi:lysophospholipase L1-like esterase